MEPTTDSNGDSTTNPPTKENDSAGSSNAGLTYPPSDEEYANPPTNTDSAPEPPSDLNKPAPENANQESAPAAKDNGVTPSNEVPRDKTSQDLQTAVDLLTYDDRTFLQSLYAANPVERGQLLRGYFETLGSEAMDFASRFQEIAERDVTELADNMAAVGLLLGSFRMVEQGNLDAEEGVTLVQRSIEGLSADLNDRLNRIASASIAPVSPERYPAVLSDQSSEATPAASDPRVVRPLVRVAAIALDAVGSALCDLSRGLTSIANASGDAAASATDAATPASSPDQGSADTTAMPADPTANPTTAPAESSM
ncbi:MAG: hypothetical protein ACYC35_21910 [Pirellulales bacterium]